MKSKIFFLSVFVGLLLLFSCSTKIVNATEDKKQSSDKDLFVEGVITTEYKDKGCDYLIKVKSKNKEKIYAAINLDESLKKENLKFQFSFHLIKAPRKGDCTKGIYIYIKSFRIQ